MYENGSSPLSASCSVRAVEDEAVSVPDAEVDVVEVERVRLQGESGGRGREQEACCEPEEHYDAPKHRAILTHSFENA